jgi:hypothetical protein
MNNTSHTTQIKHRDWNREEKKSNFTGSRGTAELKFNERADSEAKQAIKEGRDSQLLLPVADLKTQGKRKGKEELHSFCQNTKRDRRESYFERHYRNGSAPWFREIKMNRRTFVSINRMRAGHTSLKASLNRFNIVATAECECADGLQTEKQFHVDVSTGFTLTAAMLVQMRKNLFVTTNNLSHVASALQLEFDIHLLAAITR